MLFSPLWRKHPAVESTIWSIRGSGKWSFGQHLFSPVKSTHILVAPVFFFSTSTGLATHSDFLISRMKFALSNFSTCFSIASLLGPETRRIACLTGLVPGLSWRECSANSLGIPGMSAAHHANISQFSRRNSTSALSYAGDRLVDTLTVLAGSVG